MCPDAEGFLNYAKAEKELCDEAATVLTRIISEIQERHGISIAELRVTMDWSHSANGWPAANCVMMREYECESAQATGPRNAEHSLVGDGPSKQESSTLGSSDR
jgi:hypothetical protein